MAPLAGVVGVVLVLAGAVIAGNLSYLPSADQVFDQLSTNHSQVVNGSYLGIASAFFFAWFAGSLRSELRRHEGGDGRLAGLAFAGGVGSALAICAGFAVLSVAGERAGAAGGISLEGAVTLNDLAGAFQGGLYAIALAVMIGATAVVSLRHNAFPSWFGWVSALLTLILLSPFSYLGLYVSVLWLGGVSLWLYARGRSTQPA
jgi:hypothetical protein